MKIFKVNRSGKLMIIQSGMNIASADLMERAAGQLFNWYVTRFERSHRIFIFTESRKMEGCLVLPNAFENGMM